MFKYLLAFILPVSAFAAPGSATFPVRGPATAPVTVIMYGDFQCPYTKKATEIVADLQNEMPNDIKVVYRNFPLSFHPLAKPAALASVCMMNEGHFWEYYDRVFAIDFGQLTMEGIVKSALAAGAQKAALDTCMAAPETEQRVQRDLEEGELMGVMGTPNFYLVGPNGLKKVNGAYPKEEMKKFIEEVK